MGKATLSPLRVVNFHCDCGERFSSSNFSVKDAPHIEWHPYIYHAFCLECRADAEQAAWERARLKANFFATGPKTKEGKEIVTTNLEGHPTPDETKRTRFNAMKHGLDAKVAQYFPAKPGKYAACDGCEFFDECAGQVACLKRTELHMQHLIAFDTNDPGLLRDMNAHFQANIRALLDDMIRTIVVDGVKIEHIAYSFDKDGGFNRAEWTDVDGRPREINEVKAHPLLRPLIEMMARNDMALGDMGMLPRVADGPEALPGYLDQKEQTEDAGIYQKRQAIALEKLVDMVQRSKETVKADPILVEYTQELDK